jgi:hypothetical protein
VIDKAVNSAPVPAREAERAREERAERAREGDPDCAGFTQEATVRIRNQQGLLEGSVDPADAYDNRFVETAGSGGS